MTNGRYNDDMVEEIEELADLNGSGRTNETQAAGTGAQFGTPARAITIGVAVLTLFLLTGVVAWLVGSQPRALPTAPTVGALAPDFTLTDADTGEAVSLSSLRGRPVWINFWATWCHACVEEMPEMQEAYSQYRDKGLVILGVDNEESKEDVNYFTKSYAYDWTFLLDPHGDTLTKYWVEAIPTHLFVGRDGVIKAMQIGELPRDAISDLVATIIE